MQGKPHAWGFKVWARTITEGLFCDFVVCQKSVLGVGADEALKLHETLPIVNIYVGLHTQITSFRFAS